MKKTSKEMERRRELNNPCSKKRGEQKVTVTCIEIVVRYSKGLYWNNDYSKHPLLQPVYSGSRGASLRWKRM